MSVAYNQTQNENRKAPRRHLNDPSLGKINIFSIHIQLLLQNVNEKTTTVGGKYYHSARLCGIGVALSAETDIE